MTAMFLRHKSISNILRYIRRSQDQGRDQFFEAWDKSGDQPNGKRRKQNSKRQNNEVFQQKRFEKNPWKCVCRKTKKGSVLRSFTTKGNWKQHVVGEARPGARAEAAASPDCMHHPCISGPLGAEELCIRAHTGARFNVCSRLLRRQHSVLDRMGVRRQLGFKPAGGVRTRCGEGRRGARGRVSCGALWDERRGSASPATNQAQD